MSSASSSNYPTRRRLVFYHVFQAGVWRELVAEQLGLLISSGLADNCDGVNIHVNGKEPFSTPDSRFTIINNPQPWSEETPTLVALEQFCLQNSGWDVLYIHTKGITQPSQATQDWRRVMEHFCIERWDDSIQMLQHHDTVGCLYMDECYYGFFPHYSGNFWWVRSEYVQRLDRSFLRSGIRQNREFWIGTGDGSMFSFFNTGLNHYAHHLPRDMYCSQ